MPPTWAPLVNVPATGCPVERITNPSEVRAFWWEPCTDTLGCEQAVFDPAFAKALTSLISRAREQEGVTRVGLSMMGIDADYQVFTDAAGWVLDAYRGPHTVPNCALRSAWFWGNRYGFNVMNASIDPQKARIGGLLHTFAAPGDPLAFDVSPTPGGIGPGAISMGDNRWMWRYPDKLVSVPVTDGLDFVTVAGPIDKGPLLSLNDPVTTGPGFLFGEVLLPEGGPLQGIIAFSNGVDPPSPYLSPPDSSFYDLPVFAGTHVAWFRGVGVHGPNQYDSVEIWASPYSANPAELQPFKLDDLPATYMPHDAGGHGRFATLSLNDPPYFSELYVWELATKARTPYLLPNQQHITDFLGLTSKHLWVLSRPKDQNDVKEFIVRFALK